MAKKNIDITEVSIGMKMFFLFLAFVIVNGISLSIHYAASTAKWQKLIDRVEFLEYRIGILEGEKASKKVTAEIFSEGVLPEDYRKKYKI